MVYPTKRKTKIHYEILPNGCWVCTSHKQNKSGYYDIKWNKKAAHLHRYIYYVETGVNIHDMVIRHKCDNRYCINPAHLEIGTHQDNVKDRVERNRSAKGEQNGRAKLKEADVIFIKTSHLINAELARRFNVDRKTISKIKNGEMWKQV